MSLYLKIISFFGILTFAGFLNTASQDMQKSQKRFDTTWFAVNLLYYSSVIEGECMDAKMIKAEPVTAHELAKRLEKGLEDNQEVIKVPKQGVSVKDPKKNQPLVPVIVTYDRKLNIGKIPLTVGKLLAFDYLKSLPLLTIGKSSWSLEKAITLFASPFTGLAKKIFFAGLKPTDRPIGAVSTLRRFGYGLAKFYVHDMIIGGTLRGMLYMALTKAQHAISKKIAAVMGKPIKKLPEKRVTARPATQPVKAAPRSVMIRKKIVPAPKRRNGVVIRKK